MKIVKSRDLIDDIGGWVSVTQNEKLSIIKDYWLLQGRFDHVN